MRPDARRALVQARRARGQVDETDDKVHRKQQCHRRHTAARDAAHPAQPCDDGHDPYEQPRLQGEARGHERQGCCHVDPPPSSRLRQVEGQQAEEQDLREVIDRECLPDRATESVHARQHHDGEDPGGEIRPGLDSERAGEQQEQTDQQERVESPKDEPVMAVRHIEQRLDLHDAQRAEIGALGHGVLKCGIDRRGFLHVEYVGIKL